MINGFLGGIVERLVDDQARALLAVLRPPEIHREGHIQDLQHRRRDLAHDLRRPEALGCSDGAWMKPSKAINEQL
jgi:hypothetical protein